MRANEGRRYFAPEDVQSLDEALNEAWAAFSAAPCPAKRTWLAHHILMRATEGERDPIRLRDYAVMKTRLHAAWLDLSP
jgi:hypothetical protein